MSAMLPPSVRFSPTPRPCQPTKVLLLDVMDTLIADPFFRGMHCDVFGCASMKELFSLKDPDAFLDFERGDISEAQCLERFFKDGRLVDGALLRSYLLERYEWLPGMRELLQELQAACVPMAAFSNYPSPWAELVEQSTELSTLVPWAFISGERGVRKPDAAAFVAALEAVGREAEVCLCFGAPHHGSSGQAVPGSQCLRLRRLFCVGRAAYAACNQCAIALQRYVRVRSIALAANFLEGPPDGPVVSQEVVFVDDSATNVEAASRLGIASVRFEDAAQLRIALQGYGLLL